jgi:hypothetical protein
MVAARWVKVAAVEASASGSLDVVIPGFYAKIEYSSYA